MTRVLEFSDRVWGDKELGALRFEVGATELSDFRVCQDLECSGRGLMFRVVEFSARVWGGLNII